MQKHTFLTWSAKKQKNGCRLGEMHLFEFTFILYKRLSKKRLSPRRYAHSKLKKGSRLGEMHLFKLLFVYNTNDFEICSEIHVIWNELEHCFEHLTQVMNKPISSVFVFSVVYCVVFRQTLKKTRRKHKRQQKDTETNITTQRKNI